MPLSGILNLDKPLGWTSFDVVSLVRRRCRIKRVGHAGTLDPAATGILPVLLGPATRLTEYLVDATKTYIATVSLGIETDTYDAEGEIVASKDASGVTPAQVEAALAAFRGAFLQVPPAYSALKRDGVPMYKLARRGEHVDLEPRPVTVHQLDIKAYEAPHLELEVECSKGFYVRSLAHDLGAALGVGGSLSALRRTRVGSFSVGNAITVEALAKAVESGAWQDYLFAPDEVLLGWDAALVSRENAERLTHGQDAIFNVDAAHATTERCRAYDASGDFLAVLSRRDNGAWRPDKVFAAGAAGE